MSYSLVKCAKMMAQTAEKLKVREMEFTEIPFPNFMNAIQQIYEEKVHKGEYFSILFGKLITKGLEHRDYEEVANVLLMMAHHLLIFVNDNAQINELQNDKYRLQSQIGHYKNNQRINEWRKVHGEPGKNTPFKGKGVIYSAIIGAYDDVKEPAYVNPELDYILYTDNPDIKSDVWQVRLVDNKEGLDNARFSRRMKVLGHEYLPEYDYSIWIDGKLQIVGDLKEYIEKYRKQEPMLSFNHYINDCIYQELWACKSLKKDDLETMEAQIARYKAEGYPEHNGLTENAVIVREHNNPRVIQVMETWWDEIINASRRDQLSLCYACWKNDFVYDTSDLFIYGNKYVQLFNHN